MKEKIIKESTQLFFRFGVRSVSMDDIAKEIGISKKTLYVHFKDKDELIKECMLVHDVEEKQILKSFQRDAINAIDEMLRIAKYVERMLQKVSLTLIYDLQKYHREAWEMMNKMHNDDIFIEIKTNLERGIREGVYRDDFNVNIIAKIYVTTATLLTNSDFFSPSEYNIKDVIKTNILYHLHGIVSPKGRAILELMEKETPPEA
jgi:TetR/AcrR family transcriptional regulator, cholesterol catabolism regulator